MSLSNRIPTPVLENVMTPFMNLKSYASLASCCHAGHHFFQLFAVIHPNPLDVDAHQRVYPPAVKMTMSFIYGIFTPIC